MGVVSYCGHYEPCIGSLIYYFRLSRSHVLECGKGGERRRIEGDEATDGTEGTGRAGDQKIPRTERGKRVAMSSQH